MTCGACGCDVPAGFRFCGQCGAPLAEPAAAAVEAPPQDGAERRLLTVVFCDLAGSTELSERLDPEELRDFVRAYQGVCADTIGRHGGHVAQYLGDGLLVYFGYPAAHEDDGLRAVLAGLEIAARVPALAARLPPELAVVPAVRIGIHTGITVTGEVGAGATREWLALGEAPNLAARLQGRAGLNEVVLSGSTMRLVDTAVELEPLGELRLRGVSRGLEAYRAVCPRPVSGMPSRLRRFRLSPLVGRAEEVARILAAFDEAGDTGERLVIIEGEAGIGKSRVAQAVREALAGEVRWLSATCSPLHSHATLHPMITVLEKVFGIATADSPGRRLHRLHAALDTAGLAREPAAELLAAVLGLAAAGGAEPLGLPPQLRRQLTLEAVVAVLRAQATARPVVLAVDDVHLADSTTIALLGMLAAAPAHRPLLVLLTARPGFSPVWLDHPAVTRLQLAPVDAARAAELVAGIPGGERLPPQVRDAIIARGDGVPMFLEELVASVLEEAAHGGVESIPLTLQGTLMERLDRLGAGKRAAQFGAVLGRGFSEPLLRAVLGGTEEDVGGQLAELVNAGVLKRLRNEASARFAFRHTLLQEVAYESLLRSTRRRVHEQVARVLEAQYPEEVEQDPATVGHHWSLAGQPGHAAPRFARAAERAAAAYANEEAVAYFRRAIAEGEAAAAADIAASADWRLRLAAMHEGLGDVLALLRHQDEAERAFLAAVDHHAGDDVATRCRLFRSIGLVHQQERERAQAWFERAESALGEDAPDRPPEWRREWVGLMLGRMFTCYWYDEPAQMLELVSRVRPFIDEYATPVQRAEFFNMLTLTAFRQERYLMSDASVAHAAAFAAAADATRLLTEIAAARFTYGFALLFRGSLQGAEGELLAGLEAAQRSGSRAIEVRVLTYLGTLYRRLGRADEALDYTMRSLEAATADAMLEYIGMARGNLAWHALHRGDRAVARREAAAALAAWQECAMTYPFQWTALLPDMAAALADSDVEHAMDAARILLQPAQQPLPPPVADGLRAALDAWASGRRDDARDHAAAAVAAARGACLLH